MPNTDTIKVEYDPSAQDLQFLDDRIYEFNCEQTGIEDGRLFSVFLRDAENEILAGLSGWTWAQACAPLPKSAVFS
jgi:hypothetical protein